MIMENGNTAQLYDVLPNTLKLLFSFLCKYGLFSTNKFKKYFLLTASSSSAFLLLVIALIQYTTNIGSDISEIVYSLEEVLSYCHMIGKMVGLMVVQDELMMLFKQTQFFWNANEFDEIIKEKLNITSVLIRCFQKSLGMLITLTLFIMSVLAYVKDIDLLGRWPSEGHKELHKIKSIVLPLTIASFAPIIWAVDCIFLTLCAETTMQFILVCQSLRNLTAHKNNVVEENNEFTCEEKLINCIQYHQFLIRFTRKFKKVFSFILLSQFLTIGPLICAELLTASVSTAIHIQTRHILCFFYLLVQLLSCCIPVNYIAVEAAEVANAIYFSLWYAQDKQSLKTSFLIMIQNAQNEIVVKAGGIITINTPTVLNVLKTAWSLCSLVKTLN